jgi:WD40 repeat protein/serine/threonine protein kinase
MEESLKKYISTYEITETILESPEGLLYKATDPASASSVLIKVYFPFLTWSEALLNEFFDRFSYLRFIEHDNLLPILDMGKHENVPYVVYPYLETRGLETGAFRQRNEKEILGAFYEIADALDFLHKQEILHGMLAAENILLDANEHPRLFDYGLTEILRKLLLENIEDGFHNLSITRVNSCSPEQIQGRSPTKQSDIYSFGILLFYGLVGRYPFESKLPAEIAAWHLAPGTMPITLPEKKLSRHAMRFIQKCIQVEPEKRFSSFADVARVLDRTRKGKGTRLSFRPRLKRIAPPAPRSRLWWYAVPAVMLLLGLASWMYARSSPPPAAPAATGTAAATATQSLLPTPTFTETSPPPTEEPPPDQAVAHRLAIEGQRPEVVSQVITADNIREVGELSRLGYGKPEHADLSPDGRYLAVATSAGVFIYDGSRLETWIDPKGWSTAVQFSADGASLAIGLKSGEIQLWDWANGVQTSTLAGHSGRITRILFSANGRFMYSASFDQHVLVWNQASGQVSQDILAHSEAVNDLAVSSDGRTLTTCSDDHLVRVWDLAAGTKLYEMPFSEKLLALALSPDDVYMAIGGDAGFIRQYNIRTRQLRTDPIPVGKRIWSLEYINSGSKLLAGIDGGKYEIYDSPQLHYAGVSLKFKIDPPYGPLVKIHGFDFTFNSFATSAGDENNLLTLRWNGEVNHDGARILDPIFDSQERLDFSDDGTVLAASGKEKMISVWNLEDNRVLYRAEARLPQGDPISPDGKEIVVETASIYRLITLGSGQNNKDFSTQISEGVVSYANQGNILIAGNLRQSKVWDYRTGFETYWDYHPENGCLITTSTNDEEILQVNSVAGVVAPWSEDTRRFCAKSFNYSSSISAVSTDIKTFVYRNSGGLVEAFDILNSKVLWKYPAEGKPESKVLALAITSDGSIVAIGNEKGELLLMDGQDGSLLATLTGNFGTVQAIEFSKDGTRIATAGSDGTIRIFAVIQ